MFTDSIKDYQPGKRGYDKMSLVVLLMFKNPLTTTTSSLPNAKKSPNPTLSMGAEKMKEAAVHMVLCVCSEYFISLRTLDDVLKKYFTELKGI